MPQELTIELSDRDEALLLSGARDQFLREIRDALGVRLIARGENLLIKGEEAAVDQASRVFQQLRSLVKKQGALAAEDVRTVLDVVQHGGERLEAPAEKESGKEAKAGKFVRPRTDGQGRYVKSMQQNDCVLCVGPAGTGKTYLAVGMAVSLLRQQEVKKIVLVRPAVEAGERLGFLPGDLVAKVNPYLRPLLDALNDMMEPDQVKRYMDNDIIEIVPLAYMRGRTLNHAVIILDEGQNATIAQMKMFLTRMGQSSKIIVTGDITQTDLPRTTRSGLIDAISRLKDIDRIGIVYLDEHDIVRHPLVHRILRAYEKEGEKGKRGKS